MERAYKCHLFPQLPGNEEWYCHIENVFLGLFEFCKIISNGVWKSSCRIWSKANASSKQRAFADSEKSVWKVNIVVWVGGNEKRRLRNFCMSVNLLSPDLEVTISWSFLWLGKNDFHPRSSWPFEMYSQQEVLSKWLSYQKSFNHSKRLAAIVNLTVPLVLAAKPLFKFPMLEMETNVVWLVLLKRRGLETLRPIR